MSAEQNDERIGTDKENKDVIKNNTKSFQTDSEENSTKENSSCSSLTEPSTRTRSFHLNITNRTSQDGLQKSSKVIDDKDFYTITGGKERFLPHELGKTILVKAASLKETNIVSHQSKVEELSNNADKNNTDYIDLINKTKTNDFSENPHILSVTQLMKVEEVVSKSLTGKTTISNGDIKVKAIENEPNLVLKRPGEITKMASCNTLQGKRTLLLLKCHLGNSCR